MCFLVPGMCVGLLSSNTSSHILVRNKSISLLLRYVLEQFGLLTSNNFLMLPQPITLYCDNLSTIYMAYNPILRAQTNHIELDYHFVCEQVVSGSHIVGFVPLVDQMVDIFTKGSHGLWF